MQFPDLAYRHESTSKKIGALNPLNRVYSYALGYICQYAC